MKEHEDRDWSEETRLVHATGTPDPGTGSVVPPIDLSTTFARGTDGEPIGGFVYGRQGNPLRARLERVLADLEGGEEALAFGSGSAAATAVLMALGSATTMAVADDLYYGFRSLLFDLGARMGLRVLPFAAQDEGSLALVLAQRPSLVWLETPSNPLLRVLDLARIVPECQEQGALVLVDNTVATPLGQSPLRSGADLVLHATTKAMGGHSDSTGGALVVREAALPLWATIGEAQRLAGAVLSPFDAWLVLRGLGTLAVRLARMDSTALELARRLEGHPGVAAVHHPGLASDPSHAVWVRQMRAGSGLFSFRVRGGEEAAARVVSRVRLWTRATSFGGIHSLIEHRFRVEGPTTRTPNDLLRLATGLESADDLWADLDQALRR